jgi:hypothetical protein
LFEICHKKKNNIRNERNPFAQFLRLVSSSKMNEDEGQFVRTQQKSIIQVKKKNLTFSGFHQGSDDLCPTVNRIKEKYKLKNYKNSCVQGRERKENLTKNLHKNFKSFHVVLIF